MLGFGPLLVPALLNPRQVGRSIKRFHLLLIKFGLERPLEPVRAFGTAQKLML